MNTIKFKHEYPARPECPFTPEEEHEIRRNWLYGDYDGSDGVERTEAITEQLVKQEILGDWMMDVSDWEDHSPYGQATRLVNEANLVDDEVKAGKMSILTGIRELDEATDVLSDGMLAVPRDAQYVTEVRAWLVAALAEYAA